MKFTTYFREQILVRRPYIKLEWVAQVLLHPTHIELQSNGRIRHWGYINDIGKYLRVVTLSDGTTVHNAFPDRDFTGGR